MVKESGRQISRIRQVAADIVLFFSVFLVIFAVNNFILNILAYIFFYSYLIIRILLSPAELLKKAVSCLPYIFMMIFQLVFNVLIVFNQSNTSALNFVYRLIAALIVLLSIYMARMTAYRNTKSLFDSELADGAHISAKAKDAPEAARETRRMIANLPLISSRSLILFMAQELVFNVRLLRI